MWSADCHGPPQTAITLGDSMTSDPPEPVSVTWGGHLRLIELDGWFLSYQWLWEARSRRGNIRQRGSVRGAFKCLGSVFLSQLSSNSSRFFPLFYLFLLSFSPSLSLSPFFSSSPSLFSSSPSLSLSFSFLFFLSHPPSLFMSYYFTLLFYFSLPSLSLRPSLFLRLPFTRDYPRAQSSPSFALDLLIGFESPSVQCFLAGGASWLTCWRLTGEGWRLTADVGLVIAPDFLLYF